MVPEMGPGHRAGGADLASGVDTAGTVARIDLRLPHHPRLGSPLLRCVRYNRSQARAHPASAAARQPPSIMRITRPRRQGGARDASPPLQGLAPPARRPRAAGAPWEARARAARVQTAGEDLVVVVVVVVVVAPTPNYLRLASPDRGKYLFLSFMSPTHMIVREPHMIANGLACSMDELQLQPMCGSMYGFSNPSGTGWHSVCSSRLEIGSTSVRVGLVAS